MLKNKLPVVLVLDNIRSLHNVGAIFRTAAGAGVQEIILTGLTPQPPRAEISKTALGGVEAISWRYTPDSQTELKNLQEQNYTIYAIELTEDAKNLYGAQLQFPCCFIFGHEREGVSPELLQAADATLAIPMHAGPVHSLNVSTSAGIALYEAVRQFWYH